MPNSLWPHGLQHTRLPCPSLSPGVCSDSCPLSWWYYLTVSSSATPFSFCLQSFPASGSFPISQLSSSRGQSIRTSASVLPRSIQGWFPLGLTVIWSSNWWMVIQVMPSNHLIFCHPLLPSVFLSIRVFFKWVGSSHQVAKVLEFQLQHQSFQWIFRIDFP